MMLALVERRPTMAMVKTLAKHGNSLALVLDRGVLDLLDIDAATPLQITTDGKTLIVAPVRDEKRSRRFQAALAKANQRYGQALKRLGE
jgi:antitoxin component of MazEF toxin-antitoxin module